MGISCQVKRRAVFLDRDGVINRANILDGKPYPPGSRDELEILPGVVSALSRLESAGYILVVVSNQPDVARGITPRVVVDEINEHLAKRLPIHRFIMCFHDSGEGCDCRKPLPGMLFQGAAEFDVDLATSYMIGDRWRDIEAGIAAGCTTFFIDYGYSEPQPEEQDYSVGSLEEAADIILGGD